MKNLFLCILIIFSVGCYKSANSAEADPKHKSRGGKFVLDVRTADDNDQIDWFNAHSEMPAFWEKLGEKELEVWVLSKDDKDNLDQRPEFDITVGTEYGVFNNWDEMTETFQAEFIDGKFKDHTIVRAWDEYGLLSDFGIHPPILNVPYKWHADMQPIFAMHQTWWRATFPLDTIVFHTDHFWEKYNSIPEGIERSEYWKAFRNSFVLTYGDGEKKRDAIVHFQVCDKQWLVISFACGTGQSLNVKIPGYLPKPRLSFMARTETDFEIYTPSDPEGATITFNASKQKVFYYSFKRKGKGKGLGWNVILHTKLKLEVSEVRVSDNCKVKNFQSYPHMGGIFETDFEVDAEFESLSIIFPGLKRPIIVFGDHVINSNQ